MAAPSFLQRAARRSWAKGCLPASLLLALSLGAVGCSKRGGVQFSVEPPPNPPAYSGKFSTLFDDTFSPRFINAAFAGDVDELLKSRLYEADAVLGGRVRTVDAETRDGTTVYRLWLDSLSSVAGEVPSGPLDVVIIPENPTYRMVRAARERLVGQRAIVIVKYFEDTEVGTVSHVRVEPDDQTTRNALAAARF